MNPQKYQLGQTVYCFKAEGEKITIATGKILVAEINSGGFVQYSIQTYTSDGQKGAKIYANHASIASTEEEIKAKAKAYSEYIEREKKEFEDKFGGPEFDKESL